MDVAEAIRPIPILDDVVADDRMAHIKADQLIPLGKDGISHEHVRVADMEIDGCPVLLRIPRLSQWNMSPAEQLRYEATCFERAAASGVTPRYFGYLPISEALPRGALIVEEVIGRKPMLPKELPAIATCLAKLHSLPLPPMAERPPLINHEDAFAETLRIVEEQANFIEDAHLKLEVRAQLTQELGLLRAMRHEIRRMTPVTAFCGTDTHPGNFLLRDDGTAVFVDLEKVVYGSPAIDLAHATLYTSTTWDPDCGASITVGETTAFNAIYLNSANRGFRARLEPWIMPMRRLTWMRTVTWCVRWQVLSKRPNSEWAAHHLPADYSDHVQRRTEHFLSVDTVNRVRAEWRS